MPIGLRLSVVINIAAQMLTDDGERVEEFQLGKTSNLRLAKLDFSTMILDTIRILSRMFVIRPVTDSR